jgi:hypothetical protein
MRACRSSNPAMKTEKQVKTDFGNTLTAFERQAREGGV